jgi:hypothetical protein
MIKKLILIFLLLAIPVQAYTISGGIFTEKLTAIPGATITGLTISDSSISGMWNGQQLNTAHFSMTRNYPSGSYVFSVSSPGYITQQFSVRVIDSNINWNIMMKEFVYVPIITPTPTPITIYYPLSAQTPIPTQASYPIQASIVNNITNTNNTNIITPSKDYTSVLILIIIAILSYSLYNKKPTKKR